MKKFRLNISMSPKTCCHHSIPNELNGRTPKSDAPCAPCSKSTRREWHAYRRDNGFQHSDSSSPALKAKHMQPNVVAGVTARSFTLPTAHLSQHQHMWPHSTRAKQTNAAHKVEKSTTINSILIRKSLRAIVAARQNGIDCVMRGFCQQMFAACEPCAFELLPLGERIGLCALMQRIFKLTNDTCIPSQWII